MEDISTTIAMVSIAVMFICHEIEIRGLRRQIKELKTQRR